jgi:hypothetical protein
MKTTFPLAAGILALALSVGCDGCAGKTPTGRTPQALTQDELDQKFREDLRLIERYDEALGRALDYAENHPELFPHENKVVELSAAQKRSLLEIWRTVLDYMRALDATKQYWKGFHNFNVATERAAHVRSYIAGYYAFLVQYRHGLRFVELTVPSKPLETILDDAAPDLGIPKGAFAALKFNIIHLKSVSRLMGGREYYRQIVVRLAKPEFEEGDAARLSMARLKSYDAEIKDRLKDRALIDFSYNAYDIARDATFDRWFPAQAKVAEWMGDTKVRRLKTHLVSPEQIRELHTKMEPGDVLVARHNWYLSNVGLPGFWPHALLYVGDRDELSTYFDDPAVRTRFGGDFTAHLEKEFPDAWAAWGKPEHEEPRRIIEAISEGVVFSTLSHALGCDYVGVLRPRHDKVAKALAIERAFTHFGKPYDFNFDFLTDESIVCTELVFKAWQPDENKPGVALKPIKVMGRTTLPANDIVRQFDASMGTQGQLFDFVYFLDGIEKEKRAVPRDADALRASWRRPKWDVLQE